MYGRRADGGGRKIVFEWIPMWVPAVCIPCVCGTFVAVADLFVRGSPIPALSAETIKRGVGIQKVIWAYLFNLAYAFPVANWIFASTSERQFFLAAMAAVGMVGGRNAWNNRQT
jgi:hypothetical protein